MARDPLADDVETDGALEAAARRLERAVGLLEARVQSLRTDADNSAGGLFEEDRSQLAEELDQARGRERELSEAGAEASAALGRAITELRGLKETG
jgi:hypothetical protein